MRKLTRLAPLAAFAAALAIPSTAAAADNAYRAAVKANSPILYWTLDGNTVADASGHNHAGTPSATVAFGKAGAFDFAATSADLPGGATITGEPGAAAKVVEFWVRPSGKGAQTLATQGDPSGTGWKLAIDSRKKLVVTSGGKTVDPKINLPVGTWSLVDVAFAGKDGNEVWFVTNGGLTKSKAAPTKLPAAPAANGTLTLGSATGTVGRRLDEVALYPTAPANFAALKTFAKGHFDATSLPQNDPAHPPTISGTAVDGQTLTAAPGTWNGTVTSYAYQWLRCDSPVVDTQACDYIDGATASSYAAQPADIGMYLEVEVTATNAAGSSYVDSDATGQVKPMQPTISGVADEGQILAAQPHTSTGAVLAWTYQWQRCNSLGSSCSDIADATGASYTLQSIDAGKTIRVIVTAAGATATSAATPVITSSGAPVADPASDAQHKPTIDGELVAGKTLTANPGVWTGNPAPTFGYQWVRCDADGVSNCSDITGANGLAYLLTADDVDHTIVVRVTATNSQKSVDALSDPTGKIAAAPSTDPGTDPGTNPGGNPGGDPGTNPGGDPGTNPGGGTGCAVRLARVPKPKRAKVRGLGKVKVVVKRGKNGAGMRLTIKAKKAKVGRIRVKMDRRWLKGSKRALKRNVALKSVTAGRHVLRVQVKPKHGKAKTLKVVLTVQGC